MGDAYAGRGVMVLFATPEAHAANPPDSWQVVKVLDRLWQLCAEGVALDRFTTRRAAEEAKRSGFLVNLYRMEGRWYAGERVAGWRPYREVVR